MISIRVIKLFRAINLLLIFTILALFLSQCVNREVTCTVFSVEKMSETSGYGNSRISTQIYWLVTTDRGTFSIYPDGLWAHPAAAGEIKADSTYIFHIEGWDLPVFGEYPRITSVRPNTVR